MLELDLERLCCRGEVTIQRAKMTPSQILVDIERACTLLSSSKSSIKQLLARGPAYNLRYLVISSIDRA